MKTLFCFLIAIMNLPYLHAQNTAFLTKGRIEFERKFNVYAVLDPAQNWVAGYKQGHDQFRIARFNLDFNNLATLYYPVQEDDSRRDGITGLQSQSNIIYSDVVKYISVSRKAVYENSYLITDSIRNIQWKTTNERRMIAGFDCKRANAIIMDSLFVVAFYAEEIIGTGGPESFNGLPGMILGLAIPDLHISWFATKVTPLIATESIKPPDVGKRITNAGLRKEIKEVFKTKGKFERIYVANVLL